MLSGSTATVTAACFSIEMEFGRGGGGWFKIMLRSDKIGWVIDEDRKTLKMLLISI
jgi:hypothetical protein